MRIITCEQRSPEWYDVKRGVPSSSCFGSIVTSKGEPSKQATKYLYKLAAEFVSGNSEESYQNAAMSRGIGLEQEARNMYEFATGQEVKQVGFCITEGKYIYACSPDGMVGENGLIEIKCPSAAVHIEYLLGNKIPSVYIPQVQGQLLVTGRKWCDFISYYPGLKPLIVRVKPDKEFQAKLKAALESFCLKLKKLCSKLGEE